MKAKTVIKIEGLQKQFNMVDVLQDVSLEIAAGCIVGLVGSNGAGKSTLIRHMVGLYLPNEGTCETFGHDAAKLGPQELARIGYVHQEGRLIDWMTVEQMVRYVASYYPSWNTDLENSYLACLTRRPTSDEQTHFLPQLSGNLNRRGNAVEDIYWTLFNSAEFCWNH